jgi:hypothetical protein
MRVGEALVLSKSFNLLELIEDNADGDAPGTQDEICPEPVKLQAADATLKHPAKSPTHLRCCSNSKEGCWLIAGWANSRLRTTMNARFPTHKCSCAALAQGLTWRQQNKNLLPSAVCNSHNALVVPGIAVNPPPVKPTCVTISPTASTVVAKC